MASRPLDSTNYDAGTTTSVVFVAAPVRCDNTVE